MLTKEFRKLAKAFEESKIEQSQAVSGLVAQNMLLEGRVQHLESKY